MKCIITLNLLYKYLSSYIPQAVQAPLSNISLQSNYFLASKWIILMRIPAFSERRSFTSVASTDIDRNKIRAKQTEQI